MKVVSDQAFTQKDIKDALSLASFQLPVVAKLPSEFTIRVLKVGAITHCFLADEARKKFVGVSSVLKESLPFLTPSIKGVRVFQTGLISDYQGLGFIWRVVNLVGERHRVFASPSMTPKGKAMWIKRITLDHKHVYLLTNPDGIRSERVMHENKGKEDKPDRLMFVPVHAHNLKWRTQQAWDSSLKTRLLMVKKDDVIIRRYNVDVKND